MMEPSKRKYDPHSSSLDEIIRCKKDEGMDFSSMDKRYLKRSKWDRYNDSGSSENDDDDDDICSGIGTGHNPSESESDEEEPISIPLHGGCDDDSFFRSEGAYASRPNISVSEEDEEAHFDFSSDPNLKENDDDCIFLESVKATSTPAGFSLGSNFKGKDPNSHYEDDDDDDPVEMVGSTYISPDERMSFVKAERSKRALTTSRNSGEMSKSSVSKDVIQGRRILKPTRRIGTKLDLEVEEIVVSDNEDKAEKLPASIQYKKAMSILQDRMSLEISSKDCSGLTLNDIIYKAKQCFGSPGFSASFNSSSNSFNSSFSPNTIVVHKAHGCPEEVVKTRLPKYWKMRYDLFSKFDEGIQLDYESWYSVTPEVVAKRIAERCFVPNGIIIDAFCGCGGNSIQFAKVMKKVIAVDIDPVKIRYAETNAKIYGVQDKIQFIQGDFMKLAPALKADVVFLSPPWGGPSYLQASVFDLRTMIPMDGFKVFQLAQNISRNIAYFVPRTTSHEQLLELGGGNPVEVEDNILNGRKITYTAYYGDLVNVVTD